MSLRNAASMAEGSAPRRQSVSSRSGSSPSRVAISLQSVANQPVRTISTASPGDSVLASAASQAPVPEAGKIITGPLVLEDALEAGQHRAAKLSEVRPAMVDRRLGDGAQDPARDVWSGRGSAGNGGRAARVHSVSSICGSRGGDTMWETVCAKARSASSAPNAGGKLHAYRQARRRHADRQLIAGTPAMLAQPVKIAWSRGPAGWPLIRSG